MYGEKRPIAELEYLAAVNQYLISNYSITFADTGYSDEEWLSRFGDLDADEAVEVYAEKYGLTESFKGFY